MDRRRRAIIGAIFWFMFIAIVGSCFAWLRSTTTRELIGSMLFELLVAGTVASAWFIFAMRRKTST